MDWDFDMAADEESLFVYDALILCKFDSTCKLVLWDQ